MRSLIAATIWTTTRLIVIPRNFLFCLLRGLEWDSSHVLLGLPLVRQSRRGSISIGSRWTACSVARHNSIGVFQPVILRVSTPGGRIAIGENVGMSGCSISARLSVDIGNNVLIGSGALITDSDAHGIHPDDRENPEKIRSAPIAIEDNVFIGARAIILKGVKIGTGAVVGAGAVVSKDVPPFAIVAGNPARVVGDSRTA